jgi:hypothetical protein
MYRVVSTSVKHAALSDVFDCLWKDHKTQKDVKTKRQNNFGKLGPLYFPKILGTFNNFCRLLKVMKDIMYFGKYLEMLLLKDLIIPD